MDAAGSSKAKIASLIQDVEKSCDDELQQLLHTLPKEEGWISGSLYLYQGFWCSSLVLKSVHSFQTVENRSKKRIEEENRRMNELY
ncbi:hypothetical protein HRI_003838000 [Hibiscus trionum]|uniref:Uncharacterized protein n=1 Tax=Hibiscus trionum TaxID=183268 RepID=A0A9W7MF44_HIBTR|nr:hypothetical protein HRI_003838000 [Hibiscus trionum]